MRIGAEFGRKWTACWITTYTFDPAFFGSFLLPRLGDPPLNVVVLADALKLADAWNRLDLDDLAGIQAANRSYVVHPVRVPGAFHAKTILLANAHEALLLVGSGNLGLHGVERGNEVFARFEWREGQQDGPFAVWRAWMGDLVAHVDNPLVWSRWTDLLAERAPWLVQATGTSAFITNWHTPMTDALTAGLSGPCDELWLTAPFFDSDLGALGELLRRTQPRHVVLYFGADMKVDGERLVQLLAPIEKVSIRRYEPQDFVHAKLIAWSQGDRSRILSGSANVSGPALLRAAAAGGHVNVESGTIVDLPRGALEDLFIPPGHSAVAADVEDLRELSFEAEPRAAEAAIRLIHAIREDSGMVALAYEPSAEGLLLTDGFVSVGVVGPSTAEPIPESAGPSLVWLATRDGAPVSNRVPLADARSLADMLHQRATLSDRPPELDMLDLEHPIGRLLASLHQTAVFDINDLPIVDRLMRQREESAEGEAAIADRLITEQLAQDPRLSRYRLRSGGGPRADELSWLLDQMLDQAPAPDVLRLVGGTTIERGEIEREGQKWSPDQRLAVRVSNVLHRWCLALADQRVLWHEEYEFAQVRHFEYLVAALAQIWVQPDWMPEHRLIRLLETLMGAFVRTQRSPGYLATQTEEGRGPVLAALAGGPGPSLAAALAFVALRKATPTAFFDWQPFLTPALQWGVVSADQRSSDLVASIVGAGSDPGRINERLRYVSSYEDDAHWGERRARQLGLDEVRIGKSGNPLYPVELVVDGEVTVLNDPRLVSLVRDALAYRREQGIRLRVGNDLLTIALGQPVYGRVGGAQIESGRSLDAGELEELEAEGHPFADLLLPDKSAA